MWWNERKKKVNTLFLFFSISFRPFHTIIFFFRILHSTSSHLCFGFSRCKTWSWNFFLCSFVSSCRVWSVEIWDRFFHFKRFSLRTSLKFCYKFSITRVCLLRNFSAIVSSGEENWSFDINVCCVWSEITRSMMKLLPRKLIIVILILLIIASLCESARRRRVSSKFKNKIHRQKLPKLKNQKQLLYETRETNPPNFVTLLMMRLVYGLASSMGIEDRLPDFLSPPNR